MKLEFDTTDTLTNTQFAPVAALMAYYKAQKVLEPLQSVTSGSQNEDFTLADKLEQVVWSILTGCQYISVVNIRLRPERRLAQVKCIERFAEQSTLATALNELTQMHLGQLEAAIQQISHRCSRTLQHDWRGFLLLDFDLSGLPCGKQAEGSTKGYFSGKKNVTGRQLARVSAIKYGETLWSGLFPGNYLTMHCLQTAVLGVESAFDLAPAARKRTLYRLDGGAGTDKNLRWLLARDYQVLAKGFSGKRAQALARRVQRWDPYDSQSWLGRVVPTFDLGVPIDLLVRKRWHNSQWKHSYYVTTLTFPSKNAFMDHYHRRGGAEVEQFREDKTGLHLSARRKRRFVAQKALVRLTDLTHNLLANFRYRGLGNSPFANWGSKRLVRDLLAIPGRLHFDAGQLKRIELLSSHPHTEALIICLERYCSSRFGG